MSGVRVVPLPASGNYRIQGATPEEWRDVPVERWGLGRDGLVHVIVAYDRAGDVIYVDDPVPPGVSIAALARLGDLIRECEGL